MLSPDHQGGSVCHSHSGFKMMEGERFCNDNGMLRPDAAKITSIHNNRPELVTCGHLTSRGEQTPSSHVTRREK